MSSGESIIPLVVSIHSITMNIYNLHLLWASLFSLSLTLASTLSMSLLNQYSDYAGNNHAWRIFNLNITCCSAPHAQV